jgi:dihydrofolate synthase/folylpolyglutamate synthase
MQAMVASLPGELAGRRPVAVVSVLGDKDAAAMVGALRGVVASVVATRSSHPRAVPAEDIAELAAAAGITARAVPDPGAALAAARDEAGPEGVVLVAGSLYLLADLRPRMVSGAGEPPAMLARARKGIDPTEAK